MAEHAVNEDVAEDGDENPTKLTHILDNIKVQTEEA